MMFEDWSKVKQIVDRFRNSGVGSVGEYIGDHPEILTELAPAAKTLDANSAAVSIYKATSRQELLEAFNAAPDLDRYNPATGLSNIYATLVERFSAGETRVELEGPDTALDGSVIYIRTTTSIGRGYESDWGRVLHAVEDITDKKRAEAALQEMAAALRKAHDELEERAERITTLEAELADRRDTTEFEHVQKSLEESEAQLKLTVQIAKLGLWHYDNITDEYLSISDEYAQIFGYTTEEFLERFRIYEDDLNLVHPEDRAKVEAAYEVVHDESDSSEIIDIDYRSLYRDGGVRHLREIIHLRYDNTGRVTEERGTLQDVTDFKEAQLEAERASRAKSEFLSRMSHELRTPMNAVLGFGRLLKSHAPLSEEHRGFVDHILDSGEHLLGLIDEILDVSKIESGRMELSLETVESADVLGQCMVLIEPLAERHGITTENLVTRTVAPAVMADRTRLKQVLLNLASNAVKFNCDNGRVTVSCREVEGGLRISVTDTGQGLAEESIDEIFEPFARLKAEQDGIEGTGIGLAITKRLVDLMGGRLGVESTLGKGSTFWVEFPLAFAPGVERVEAERTASETNSNLKGRILLAEDNPLNQTLVLAMLEQHDLEVDAAENGHEVVEAYLARSYDLVLMDCQMPQMDGYEATAEIRRCEIAAGASTLIPIIALTANAMSGDRERCLAVGMNDYLTKPFTPREIFEMLARWLPVMNH